MNRSKNLIVVALGGNAFFRENEEGIYMEQQTNIVRTSKHLADLLERDYRLVITHGNGPQVGATLLRHEAGASMYDVPALPMHVCVAETQGFIGYMVQQSLRSELKKRGLDIPIATLITRVIIHEDDPQLKNPSKPIGPFYSWEEMVKLEQDHPEFTFIEDKVRSKWRRVVPSPDPQRIAIAELGAISTLVDKGFVVVACGGGGIPIIERDGWQAIGIDAVIDKDLASERLATQVGAGTFIMLTDVDATYIDYGKQSQSKLGVVTVSQAIGYLEDGHFGEGSMRPKVLAAIRFVQSGGNRAVIARMTNLLEAFASKEGTQVIPDGE